MIRNGLYAARTKALDGVVGGELGVVVLRDGALRGGSSFFYAFGTYSCSDGNWKGEVTMQEHTPAPAWRPMAGKVVSLGFSGTYNDEGAVVGFIALVGNRSIRYDGFFRLLIAD
jgi:hypothetical protein